MKLPLAIPGRAAYLRLKSELERASGTDARIPFAGRDAPGPGFRVRLRVRRFRGAPQQFAFLQIGVAGRMLRLHPADASAGDHVLRISRDSGLVYLTEPETGRTWVSTLGPFAAARRTVRDVSAVAIAAPYDDLATARESAPRLAWLARWLAGRRQGTDHPPVAVGPIVVRLSGVVVPGLRIIDPVSGRQVVTLRSQSLRAGLATLAVTYEALALAQGETVVHFPMDDVLARWGNQLTRSAIYVSPADARARAAELVTHRLLAELMVRALAGRGEPDASAREALDRLGELAAPVRADRRGSIGLALPMPRRLGGSRFVASRVAGPGPHARFVPALCWIPRHGLLVAWTGTDGRVVAFSASRAEVRRLGMFDSIDAAREAAGRIPAVLLADAIRQCRGGEPGDDLLVRIGRFNAARPVLKAVDREVRAVDPFTGSVFRFEVASARGAWQAGILLSAAGPVWVLQSPGASRNPAWHAFGPLRKDRPDTLRLCRSAEGRGRLSLEGLAAHLSAELELRVTAAGRREATVVPEEHVRSVLRGVLAVRFRDWPVLDDARRADLFYRFAAELRDALSSDDPARRRQALLVAEHCYFGKPAEHLALQHARLFKRGPEGWAAGFVPGGPADSRARDVARGLGVFVFERPAGLSKVMKPRFTRFRDAVTELLEAPQAS